MDPVSSHPGPGASSVLLAAPEELHRACRLLRAVGDELETVGARVAEGPGTDAWSGLAAWEQRARVCSVKARVVSAAAPPREAAAAVERCAEVAERAAGQVRSWDRVRDRALEQMQALRALGPPPEPTAAELWRQRLVELAREQELARRWSQEAEQEYASAQRLAADAITRAWTVAQDVLEMARVPERAWKAAGYAVGTVARLALATETVLELARARWARTAAVRAGAARRVRALMQRLRALSRTGRGSAKLRGLSLTPGPLGMTLAWVGAWSDVRDGGGYAGWRGGLTRVFAAGAIGGGPVAVLGFWFPPAAVAGVSLLGAYQAWTLGNLAWDGVGTVRRYAGRFAARLPELRARVARAAARASLRLHEVRHRTLAAGRRLTVEVGHRVDRVEDAVGKVLRRLPDVEPARRWWRDVGQPIRLPQVPLGPVLRAPIELGRLWP